MSSMLLFRIKEVKPSEKRLRWAIYPGKYVLLLVAIVLSASALVHSGLEWPLFLNDGDDARDCFKSLPSKALREGGRQLLTNPILEATLQEPIEERPAIVPRNLRRPSSAEKTKRLPVNDPGSLNPAVSLARDGLIFCPIAKVACAEWRRTLRWMSGVEGWEYGHVHKVGLNGLSLLSNEGVETMEETLNSDEWLKLVVVRDPVERLLSGFLDKCAARTSEDNTKRGYGNNCPYLDWMPDLFNGEEKTSPATSARLQLLIQAAPELVFGHFVANLRKMFDAKGENVCEINNHFRPQYCYCNLKEYLPAFHVIPFQNMSTLAPTVADTLVTPTPGRKKQIRDFLSWRFATDHDTEDKITGAGTKVSTFVTPPIKKAIRELYKEDYELLGEFF